MKRTVIIVVSGVLALLLIYLLVVMGAFFLRNRDNPPPFRQSADAVIKIELYHNRDPMPILQLEGADAQAKKPDAPAPVPEQVAEPAKVYTYEEVRAILAEKSRTGFRAEVKSILTKHGVAQLSDVKDPNVFAAIVAEAEEIKVG